MRSILQNPLFILAVTWPTTLAWSQEDRQIDRTDFAGRIAQVKLQDNMAQVEALLGRPDFVVKRTKGMEWFFDETTSRVWKYGANDANGLGTLGQVHFDAERRVIDVIGGEPPASRFERISECQLRDILRQIHSMPVADGWSWNPATAIEAANAVRAIGAEDGMAAIKEYLRIVPPSFDVYQRVNLLLRLVHRDPNGGTEPRDLSLGFMSIGAPMDPDRFPQYPIYIAEDVPLLIVGGFGWIGELPTVDEDWEWYRSNVKWTDQVLSPPQLSKDEIARLTEHVEDVLSGCMDGRRLDSMKQMIHKQLNRLASAQSADK